MEKQVIQSVGFRNIEENGEIVGFQLKIRLPYYRGVYLSQIKPGHLIVDGESFGEDEIMWRVNGEDFTYTDMRKDCNHHWHPMEPATLIVRRVLLHPLVHAAVHGSAGESGQACGHLFPRVRSEHQQQTPADRINLYKGGEPSC